MGEIRDNFGNKWFVGKFRPWLITGYTDKGLVTLATETVMQGQLKQGGHRVGIAVVNRMTVVNVPEPDMLREPVVLKEPVFRGVKLGVGQG